MKNFHKHWKGMLILNQTNTTEPSVEEIEQFSCYLYFRGSSCTISLFITFLIIKKILV